VFGGVPDIRGFIGFPAIGHRSQIGAIGLYQYPVEGSLSGYLLDRIGTFERHDAGERYGKSDIQGLSGDTPVFGKTMHDPARVRCTLFTQNSHCVGSGVPGMDDERFGGVSCRVYMAAKSVPLPFEVSTTPEIVQTGFADRDNLGILCMAAKFIDIGFVP